MPRRLFYPLNEAITQDSQHPVEDRPIKPFVWGSADNTAPIEFIGKLSFDEYIQLSSAVDVGCDIAYPDRSPEILYAWHKMVRSFDIVSGVASDCDIVPAWSSALEYFYNDPYLEGSEFNENVVLKWITFQDIVDIFPQWLQDVYNLFGGVDRLDLRLGYRNDDVFFLPASTFNNILSPFDFTNGVLAFPQQFLPSIVLRFRGEGTVTANVLSTPAGGSVIGVVDRPFSLQDTLDAINTQDFSALTGFQAAELQRDIIQFPPETVAEVSLSWDITGDTTHTIELFYIPRFNDSLEFLGFGGGFRNFEVCEGITLIDSQGGDILRSQHNAPRQGYLSTTRRQLDEAIKESESIQLVQANVERSNDINAGLYGFASDIFDKLDSSNTDSFTAALVWERRYQQRFDNPESIIIPIENGYEAFRLRIQGTSDDPEPRPLYCYVNGDLVGTNYFGYDNGAGININQPVIGRIMTNGAYASTSIVATMYDYSRDFYGKVMTGQYYGINQNTSSRFAATAGFYYAQSGDVNQITLVPSGVAYQTIEVEVDYLKEELVMRSQDLGLKPPPPADLDDVIPQGYSPEWPDFYYYSIDDTTDFINVPGAWDVDSVNGNPAPSLTNEISGSGGGNFTIEFSQPISIRKITFELFVIAGSYVIDEIRTIAYDVNNVDLNTSVDSSEFMPELQWYRFEFNFNDVGQVHDRALVQILWKLDASGDTFATIAKIDNIYIEGIIP